MKFLAEPSASVLILAGICASVCVVFVLGGTGGDVCATQTVVRSDAAQALTNNICDNKAGEQEVNCSSQVITEGVQKYVNKSGTSILLLNWGNHTFSRSQKEERLRVDRGAESAERVSMSSGKTSGSTALGESVVAKKMRVRTHGGSFRVEGKTLILDVTEGYCSEGKSVRMVFIESRQTIMTGDSSEEYQLTSVPEK